VAPLLELFLDFGGLWLSILGALTWIAYTRLSSISDEASRWVKALSVPWVMKAAVGLALLAWAWSFGRLFVGEAYLRGAGTFAELSTALLGLILILAGLAWKGIHSGSRFHPWGTYGVVLALIVSSGRLLGETPQEDLSAGLTKTECIAYLQGRLAQLGCFEAMGEPNRRDGRFDTLTEVAVIAFQQENELLQDPKLDTPGVIRPDAELPLLTRPFPFLFGPRRCPQPRTAVTTS